MDLYNEYNLNALLDIGLCNIDCIERDTKCEDCYETVFIIPFFASSFNNRTKLNNDKSVIHYEFFQYGAGTIELVIQHNPFYVDQINWKREGF